MDVRLVAGSVGIGGFDIGSPHGVAFPAWFLSTRRANFLSASFVFQSSTQLCHCMSRRDPEESTISISRATSAPCFSAQNSTSISIPAGMCSYREASIKASTFPQMGREPSARTAGTGVLRGCTSSRHGAFQNTP